MAKRGCDRIRFSDLDSPCHKESTFFRRRSRWRSILVYHTANRLARIIHLGRRKPILQLPNIHKVSGGRPARSGNRRRRKRSQHAPLYVPRNFPRRGPVGIGPPGPNGCDSCRACGMVRSSAILADSPYNAILPSRAGMPESICSAAASPIRQAS